MNINRQVLVNILKLVSPALASEKNQVRELHHFWFDGDYVSAFNDILGVRLELETDFKGGVNGAHLLGILENCTAPVVRLNPSYSDEGDSLDIRAGAAIIKLALLPIEDLLWKPNIPKDDGYIATREFLAAINQCIISVGRAKVLTPEQRGITLVQNDSNFDLFATDSVSLSWVRLNGNSTLLEEERSIIPTPFCEQLNDLCHAGSILKFDSNSVYCESAIMVGEVQGKEAVQKFYSKSLLFTTVVEDEEAIDFIKLVNNYTNCEGNFSIPKELKMSIDRAMVILPEGQPVQLKVGKDEPDDEYKSVSIFARAEDQHGEVDDAIMLEKDDKHPDIRIMVDAKTLKRGLDACEQITITEDCIVMRGKGEFVHVVATK